MITLKIGDNADFFLFDGFSLTSLFFEKTLKYELSNKKEI